jgi:acyl-CoA synthetase (AMP-forming)/AMP-acid ligase II
MLNIAYRLSQVASKYGQKTGLVEVSSGHSLTFGELDMLAAQYASYLDSQGVKAGMRVMLMVKPSADFICLTFALFRIGAPVILIDPGMGYRNLLKCIAGVKPDYLIGIPLVILFRTIFRKSFQTVKRSFSCGKLLGLAGTDIREKAKAPLPSKPLFEADNDSLAAIIFTTGSTGPPKGVRFEHSIFSAQLRYIKDYYKIGPDDIDQPGFPLFGLFSVALGACAVIPDMNPSQPARVNPEKFISSILKYKVTYSFGSPAIWNVVSNYCMSNKIRSSHLKKILMAGAPVSGELIKRVYNLMEEDGQIFTPYGATESLPIVSIEGREILEKTWEKTRKGKGTCVGRPLPGIDVKVVEATSDRLVSIIDYTELPANKIGEIIVKGDVVTRCYENNHIETEMSKIADEEGFWHRIGDVGYLDDNKRLWFCGRKAHRVNSRKGTMDTIPCESIINEHPCVFRSALVGIDQDDGYELPAVIVELNEEIDRSNDIVLQEIRQLAENHINTREIKHFLIHPSFPVDIRHNAKIFREKLKVWAQRKLA